MQPVKCSTIFLLILTTLAFSALIQIAKAGKTSCHVNNLEWIPFISCDKDGNKKTTFYLSDNVYVKGGWFPFHCNDNVTIYVMPNGLKINETKPENAVSGPAINETDGDGHLPITCIWNATLSVGEYDVWVDVNQNGIFDDGDLFHYYFFCCCYLFRVIPEYLAGSIGGVAAMIGALALFRINKLSKPSKNSPRTPF